MKPRGDDSSSRSCSCTSCFYKTESENPSVRRMLAKGSRIDKLFIGKYLPLREEKLLNRLVRTRAIYDDIRTQLLSDSNVSESDKGDLKPAKQMPLKREGNRKDTELSEAERSSVLLQLVNLVDRGATLGPHRLSECCSCCVCGPRGNTFGEAGRPQKHRHRHASSRSSFTSGMRTRDERRLASHGHRARYIKSDPCNNCTCTNEDCISNRGSKALIKKDQKRGVASKEIVTETKVGGRQKIKGFKTRQGMGETFSRSITKLKKSKSQMSAKFKSKIKKSMEIMKATEQGVRGKIRKHTKRYKNSEILYSLRGGERRKKTKEELEQEVEEAIAKIKKDSLTKIREDMKKKKFIEEWACDFECDPKECEPEECLKIKVQQKMRRRKKRVHYKEKNIGDTNRKLSKTRISQTTIPAATTKTETKKQETKLADLKTNTESNEPQIKSKNKLEETETNQPKPNNKIEAICECKTTTSSTNTSKLSVKSITELPSTTTKTSSASETTRQKRTKPKASIVIQTPKKSSASETTRQKRTKPKASIVIQTPKINVRSGGYALKRCFCTLKLRPKGNKPQRPRSSDSKSLQTKTSNTRSTTASTTKVECECEQRKARTTTTNTRSLKHRTKSTSSLISKSSGGSKSVQAQSSEKVEKLRPSEQLVIKRKDDDEPTSNKQAVRISSSFSFNIEFYKETPSTQKIAVSETETHKQESHSQRRTHMHHRKVGKHRRLANTPSQMTSSSKSKNTLTKHKLRRCFCTLKFAKKDALNTVTYSKGTLTSGQSFTEKPILRNIGTEKRLKRPKYAKYQLLPYECEPGICVPGECDPYQCLEFMKKRNLKQTSRGSSTFNRKTKSTYSITGRRGGRSKTKKVQSVSATHKEDKSLVIPQREVASSPSRQAVRFGSSFSFDIEFYKDKPQDTQKNIEIVKEPPSSVKMKPRGSRQKHKTKYEKSTSVVSNTKEKGIFVGSAMKRCFCTLKLQKKAKKQVVSSTAATETVPVQDAVHPDMVTRPTQMKKKKIRQLGLLPYECEPGTCVPGACDPYQCLERIKMRNKRLKDFGTGTITNKSAASTTSSSNSRNALTQSNLRETRKKLKRSKYTTSSSYSKVPIPVVSKSSRQAVRVGSNFSFNIEFAKKEPEEVQSPDKPVMEIPIRNVKVKEKGGNPDKTKLKHSESQSAAAKKINKGSRIQPILKKCFCTLKLQKNKVNLNRQKINKPVETIVMPAQVFNKNFALSQYTNNTKYVVRKKNIEQNDIDMSSLKLSPPMATTSKNINWLIRNISTVSSFNITKILNREERGSISLEKKLSRENNKTAELNLLRSQLIGVSPYLQKSFYALNFQVQNKQKKMNKLLPYECEPGVCVPGECDPHECLKLINKRLMKRSSTMTTTDSRSQSTSSGGTRRRSSQQQFGTTHRERADKGRDRVVRAPRAIKYESPPTQSHKQAVRVGSSFSFDIEFFKDKSSHGNKHVVQEKRRKDHNVGSGGRTVSRSHKGTRGSQILRRDTPSQSSIMTQNKGQNITRPKRCFCTLKLQKRGKQHVQVGHEAKPPIQYTNTGQNTKNLRYKLLDLDPNECEPGVCIPGKCDPYECLERIKRRRKDFGSGMRPSMMSSSSMTSQLKKYARGKHVQINEKRRKSHGSKSTVSSVSRPNVTKTSVHPSRQAVRIGSSFSFNVEFYKDRSHGQDAPMTASGPAPIKMKTKTKDYNQNTRMRRSPSSIGRSSQDSTTLRHQNTQHGPNTRAIGTKTGAFLKRCFCTAKFFQKSNGGQVLGVPANVEATPSLMQRCLCTLKLLTAKNKEKHPPKPITGVSSQTDKIKEKKIKPVKQPKLEPYECEPGICVPGQCDPYKCLERINRRNQISKMSSTENGGTRSTSTGFRSSRSSRSTGSYARTRDKEKRHGDRKQKHSRPSSTPVVKPVTITPSLNRNVVRIGSNFSFNIEFYKDQISPSYQNVQRAAKEVKNKRHSKSTASAKTGRGSKTRGVNKFGQSHSRESQADFIKKEDRATGMLKRCFCTLALHKQTGKDKVVPQKALIVKEQGTKSPYYKTYPTVENKNTITKRPYKLEPYECEPGVCIPGECDPHECLKRIQRRREQGTSTPRHRTSSSSTLMRQRRKLRDAQSVTRHNKVARPSQQQTRPSKAPRPSRQIHYEDQGKKRQAVRIGSNFSFNIEFSKSRTSDDQAVKISKEPRADRYETRSTSSKPERRGSTRSSKSQGRRRVRDSGSQGLRNQVRSTLTETTPFLKRCFCTLKFKNIDKKPHGTNIKPEVTKPPTVPKPTQHREKGISTPKEKPFKNLLPYECEPGVCVPGQCDPNECLKRIEKRNMQTKMAYTDRPRGRGMSTATAETKTSSKGFQNQADFRAKKTHGHARDGRVTPVRKQTVTHSARNKQAVRVGSSFSFDVEFSKDKTNKTPFHTNTPNVYSTLVSTKNITTDPGFKKYRTAMSSSDRKLINRRSQSIARKTASSGSGVGPLFKRCFCTLKLQKLGRSQRPSKLRTNSKVIKKPMSTNKTLDPTLIKYKDTGMATKNKYRDLLPYECEPNICVPGQCNPYECLERIKKRNMCDSTTNCMNRNTKSVSSLAGRKSRIRKLQTLSDRSGVKKSVAMRQEDRKRNVNITETENGDRQIVRIGSNFSFNMEFYKEHTPKNFKNVTFDTLPKIDRAYNTRGEKLPKTISRGSFSQGQGTRHKELQARVGQEHKSSGMKPFLQRCFCTLKLLEGNKQPKPPGPDVQVGHEAKSSLQYKDTGQNTKKYQHRLSNLDPNECEPGVCIPGECDPYECLQRIKRRNIRHMATEVRSGGRCSQASLTSFGPISKSKRIQYSPKTTSQRAKMFNIVEQPRFPFLEREYYQGLKIGSNVSVNIEFYKEHALPTNGMDTEIISRESKNVARNRYNQTSSKPDKGSSMKTNTCNRSRNCMQQAGVITENKSSFVGNALKRCFCTAKLVGRKSLMTVGRVDKLITNSPFQPRKLQIYQMSQAKSKNQNTHCDPNCIILKTPTQNAATRINDKYFSGDPLIAHQKGNKNSDEMKTILPYAPKKFNKNESKTLVMRKKKETGSSNKDDVPRSKSAKRLTGKQEKTLIRNQNGLKRFMCTCINNILKNKNKSIHSEECAFKKDDDNNTNKVSKNKTNKAETNLKMSKSERKPDKKVKSRLKKSKSLNAKNTKVTSTNPFVCPHCQACFDNKSKISEAKKAGGDDVRTLKKEQNNNKSQSKGRMDLKGKVEPNKSKSRGQQQIKGPCCVCKGDEKRLNTKNPDAKLYGLKLTKGSRIPPPHIKKGTTKGKETSKKSEKPCICGSSVCAKEAKKGKSPKTAKEKQKKTGKPCVCGSPVCAKEAKKLQGTKDKKGSNKDDNKTKKDDKKRNAKNLCACDVTCECIDPNKNMEVEEQRRKIANAELERRRKEYAKEDAVLKEKRRAKEMEMYKQVQKTKNAGDCALLTESMLDIAKLGCTTTGDVLRSTYRTIMDPKNTARNVKTCIRDPRRAITQIKQSFGESGLGSTCKRIILRFKMMKRFQSAHRELEECAVTNYLIHIADKDPKKRLKPKKKKKTREPMDFECSPYMASLRNRPCLAIYFACPWFYPHCLSILNIWRQFTDILLFLLAVVVWSPCIVLMEGCRAMMCCFLCTG